MTDLTPLLSEPGASIAVIGVSPDEVASHEEFAEKYELPFPLVADPEHKILEAYGVWGERNLYGRKFMGVDRATFTGSWRAQPNPPAISASISVKLTCRVFIPATPVSTPPQSCQAVQPLQPAPISLPPLSRHPRT